MRRRKTVPDDLLLDRLMAPMMAHGPAELSFAKASKAVGLAAATLVQRFGSREKMVEAILLRAWDQLDDGGGAWSATTDFLHPGQRLAQPAPLYTKLDEATAAADAWASPDPAGAIAFLLRLTNSGAAEYDFTDGLLLLREDMRNPVLRRRGAEWGARLAEALGRRLGDAADQAAQLGWQMASLWQGTLLWWAFQRDAAPEAKVREARKTWSRTVGVL